LDRSQELISQWSKEFDLPESKLTDIIDKLKSKHLYWESLDKNWKYPSMGDDQKSNLMLDAMFFIELRKGAILYLPLKEG